LWYHHLQTAKQPDPRLPRYPLCFLDSCNLQIDLDGSQSAIFQDPENGEIVGMVMRNFLPSSYESILHWVDSVVVQGADLRRSIRLEDPGKLVQIGYSGGSRSKPSFDWARNLLSKKHSKKEVESFNYTCSSVFALFWNMSRKILHPDIIGDIESFLESGVPRMDMEAKGERGSSIYTITYKEEEFDFHQGVLAPPVGFFSVNYARTTHHESSPHKYGIFWTTSRTLGKDGGGHFYISDYGIRIQGAENTVVAWRVGDYHGTTLSCKGPENDNGKLQQAGMSICTPKRLPALWKKYFEENLKIGDMEEELIVDETQGEIY